MKTTTKIIPICASWMLLTACPGGSGSAVDGDGTDGVSTLDSSTSPTATVTATATSATVTTTDSGTSDTAEDSTSAPTSTTTSGDGTADSTTGDCVDAAECANGIFCDGVEACVGGACVAGDPIDCDDQADCTADACDAELDACVHQPDNSLCGCGETCDAELGCGDHCVVAGCQGQIYQCGNCIDDDGDCAVDNLDTDCWGPCDNNESGWNGEVPGQQNQSTCLVMDCYFDSNSGAGNDECYWSHSCDPLEPMGCTLDGAHNIPGSGDSCAELEATQSEQCGDYCGPLTPNGCDCFGCCEVTLDDATSVTVYLGTTDAEGEGTCNLDNVEEPALCNPCTQVSGCLNTCSECEICIGQLELPPGCDEQVCAEGFQPCGLVGQDPCPASQACITGCCFPEPQ